jgi:hypothetical protein
MGDSGIGRKIVVSDIAQSEDKSGRQVIRDAVVLEQNRRSLAGLGHTKQLHKSIEDCNAQWRNTTENQRAGRVAEVWHSGTFNADAAKKGVNLTSELTQHGTPADIRVTRGGSGGTIVSEAQV